MYNYNMGSPPLPDILGQYYAQPDLFGPSTSGQFAYDTTAGAAGLGASGYTRTSPIPPRRRYSIGGLPSATMTDFYNLTQNASSSNIANLLNEASKSISRSSQILNQRYGGRTATISSYPQLNFGDSYLNDNLMQMSTSFSSQPNIYIQPYTSSFDKTTGQTITGGTTTQHQSSPYLSSRLRPTLSSSHLNYLYSRPMYSSSSYNPYLLSNYLSQPSTQNLLYHQRNLMPSHHASNPALSHNVNYPQQQHHLHQQQFYNPPISQYLHHPYHLQQQIQQQMPQYHLHQSQPFSSSGYMNQQQHFDDIHQQHPYQVPLTKLDLDYPKPPETKRQVSFKFDVDTLSVDS